jgi:hypothetical protein
MAQGSHATWVGVPPERRHCDTCGRTLSITKDTLRIGWPGGRLEVVCGDCLPHVELRVVYTTRNEAKPRSVYDEREVITV